MKKVVFLGLIILLIVGSCTQETKSPIEGTWQLIYGKWIAYEQTFPTQIKGSSLRIYSNEYYLFAGQLKLDTVVVDPYGGGSYTLEGDRFEELTMYRWSQSGIGSKDRFLIEVRNDTLIQRWPVDENWKLVEMFNIEKYIRLK